MAAIEQLDTENADRNLTSQVTVLTDTPDVSGARLCQVSIQLGDGVNNLDGTGGTFELEILVDGNTINGGVEYQNVGTKVRTSLQSQSFICPPNMEVVVKLKSPNSADTGVDVTAYLYDVGPSVVSADLPANFAATVITAGGAVDSLIQGFLNDTIAETTADNIAANFEIFWDNANVLTAKTVDDVGGSGASAADVADAVWDEAEADHTAGGSFGSLAAAIFADTDQIVIEIGTAGAGLTDLGGITNISSLVVSASGEVDSLVQGFLDINISETTDGNISDNFDTFYDNANVLTTKTVDDVGGGGSLTVAAIADGVWDEVRIDHTTAGSFGEIATEIASILVDTSTTIPATITTAQNDLDVITGADGVNLLSATQSSIDAIEVDTAEIGTAGAGLTALAGITNISSLVVSASGEVDSLVQGFLDINISETTDGNIASNHSTFWDNANAITANTVDNVGGGSDRSVLASTTIATLSTQTSFTLDVGSSDNDAYNGCTIVVEFESDADQKAVGIVNDYVGSTKTVTLLEDPGVFTMAAANKVFILAEKSLKPTTSDDHHVDVTSGGNVGVDFGNISGTLTNANVAAFDANERVDVGQWVGGAVFLSASTPVVSMEYIKGTALTEATSGRLAQSFSTLFDNGDSGATAVLDDITSILTDTGTTLQAELDGIQADTEDIQTQIGTAGAGLTGLGGMSTTMKAEVNAEADTALTDYDALVPADLPSNFSALVITAGGAVDSLIQGFLNDTIAETTADNIAANFEIFWDNANAITAQTVDDVGGSGASAADVADAVWDEAEADHTAGGSFGSLAAAIFADTDQIVIEIGTAGAGLTDLGGMSTTMKAQVNTECDTALTDYDGPTNAEMVARTLVAASYFDPAADTVATVTTLTGHTPQTGDSFARLGAPAGASVSADIATVDSNVDAILVDTADMQPKLGTITDLGAGATLGDNLADMAGATFSTTTDSLEANRDRGDAAWTTGAGGSDRLIMADTTIATLASQTSFTLTAGSADDDAYNGCTIVVEDVATATQKARGVVDDYAGSTKTITLLEDPGVFTMAATDKVYILAESSLKPTTQADYHVDVTSGGNVGIDWGNVSNPTTAVDLSGTDIQLADTVTTLTGHTAQTGDTFALANGAAGFVAIDTVVDAILVDTGTTLDAAIAVIDANVDSILVDTAEIGAAGAGLTGLGGMSATMKAQVNTECDTALTDYDPPTNAEMVARTLVAASYFDPASDTVATVTTLTGHTAQTGDTYALANGVTGFSAIDTVVDAIKVKTDYLTQTYAGSGTIDVNLSTINNVIQTGGDLIAQLSNILTDTGNTLPATLATIDGIVDSILVDTGTTIPATITTAQNDLDIITGADGVNLLSATQASIDAIEVDTGTTLQAELDGIQADTEDIQTQIGTAGAGLTAIPAHGATTGTADSGSTTTMVDAVRNEADNDYWKGGLIKFTSGTISGQTRSITGFTAATDTLTFEPATTQAVGTNTYELLPFGRADLLAATQASIDATEADTNELQVDDYPTTLATLATATALTTAQNDLDIITGADGVNLLSATQASIDATEADTNELQVDDYPTTLATLATATALTTAQNDLDIITGADGVNLLSATQASIDAIEVDTGTTLDAAIAVIDANVDQIEAAVITNAAGVDIAADIIALKAETVLIVADTNELQTDWADGGRLDLIIDELTTNIDAIETDTADLQSQIGMAGAGLTDLGGMSTTMKAQVNTEADSAIVTYGLDHLIFTSVIGTDIADDSIVAFMTSKSATADWDDFVNTTDSLQAIRDNQSAGTGLTALSTGTAQSATSTTLVLAASAAFADDELIGNMIKITGGTGVGQSRQVTDNVLSSDTVTVDRAWTTTPDATSTYEIVEGVLPDTFADALLVRDVDNVEGTANEHTLCTVVLGCLESSISGTTLTIKRTDGSTTHVTKTLTKTAGDAPIRGIT